MASHRLLTVGLINYGTSCKQIDELRQANAVKDAELIEKDAKLNEKNTTIEGLKAKIKTQGYVQYLGRRCVIQHLQSPFASLCC